MNLTLAISVREGKPSDLDAHKNELTCNLLAVKIVFIIALFQRHVEMGLFFSIFGNYKADYWDSGDHLQKD